MDVEQLIEKLGRPLSSCRHASWVSYPLAGFAMLLDGGIEYVVADDGLTDADGMALAKDFNEFLRTMNRLKGARRG